MAGRLPVPVTADPGVWPEAFIEGRQLALTGRCPGKHERHMLFMDGLLYGTLERMGEVPALDLNAGGTLSQTPESFVPRTPWIAT